MLIPNDKQKTKLMQCFGVSRFAYNWTLEKQQENYNNGGKFISDNELRKEFTKLKRTKEYEWLNQYLLRLDLFRYKHTINPLSQSFISTPINLKPVK